MNHKIRLYEKGDEYQIIRLFKEVYGKDLTVEQWRWKYLGQGNLRVWSVVAFNEKDELIAHYGGIPVRMIFKGRHIVGCQCVDAMVRKEYRAKEQGIPKTEGVFYRICNLFYDTFGTFFYAFPGDVYYNWGRKVAHIEECMDVPEYRYHNPPSPPFSKGGMGGFERGGRRSIVERFYSLKPLKWDDRRIDELWERVKGGLGWTMVRDREFIEWRYRMNPFYGHSIYGLERLFSDRLLGWVVFREKEEGLLVMDLVFEDSFLEILLRKLIYPGCSLGKEHLRIWLPDRYKERLVAVGFKQFDIRTWIPNFIRFNVATSEEIRQNLYYTMGDTDFL